MLINITHLSSCSLDSLKTLEYFLHNGVNNMEEVVNPDGGLQIEVETKTRSRTAKDPGHSPDKERDRMLVPYISGRGYFL
jgi:hypothetical protein